MMVKFRKILEEVELEILKKLKKIKMMTWNSIKVKINFHSFIKL
jgi:hypothetical protein